MGAPKRILDDPHGFLNVLFCGFLIDACIKDGIVKKVLKVSTKGLPKRNHGGGGSGHDSRTTLLIMNIPVKHGRNQRAYVVNVKRAFLLDLIHGKGFPMENERSPVAVLCEDH